MDKFVIRTPTWKTLTYEQTTFNANNNIAIPKINSRIPLKNSQINKVSNNMTSIGNRSRFTITSSDIQNLLLQRPSPALRKHDSDMSSPDSIVGGIEIIKENYENINPSTPRKYDCKSQEYMTPTKNKILDVDLSPVTPTHVNNKVILNTSHEKQPKKIFKGKKKSPAKCNESTTNKVVTPNVNRIMTRIENDLQSPSAFVRTKALLALKNPITSTYAYFDVSHTEADVISNQEKNQSPSPISMKDVLHNIKVYVEIRSGQDNRSAGVKKVISALGAHVNDKLIKGTTHVVFKDGRLSTYKKAKHMKIPIVSILWIEACRNLHIICNPLDFPISNLDRYENPELYDKMKRQKSMQPDSELNRRIRPKSDTPNKKTAQKETKSSNKKRSPKKTELHQMELCPTKSKIITKRTEIEAYFRRQQQTNTLINAHKDSPATELLNRMISNNYTPLKNMRLRPKIQDLLSDDEMLIESNDSNEEKKGSAHIINRKEDCIKTPQIQKALSDCVKTQASRRQSLNSETMQSEAEKSTLTVSPITTTKPKTRRRNSVHIVNAPKTTSESPKMTYYKNGIAMIEPDDAPPKKRRRSSVMFPIQTENDNKNNKTETGTNSIDDVKALPCIIEEIEQKNNNKVLKYNQVETTHFSILKTEDRQKIDEVLENTEPINKVIILDIKGVLKKNENDVKNVVTSRKELKRRSTYTNQCLYNSEIQCDIETDKEQTPLNEKPDSSMKIKLKDLPSSEVDYYKTPISSVNSEQYTEKSIYKDIMNMLPVTFSKYPLSSIVNQSISHPTLLEQQRQEKEEVYSNVFQTRRLTTYSPINLEETCTTEPNENINTIMQTPTTVLEQHASKLSFSSTRLPGKRRTVFDLSMEIITERVKKINENSRRSICSFKPVSSDNDVRRSSLDKETPTLLSKSLTTLNVNEMNRDNNLNKNSEIVTGISDTNSDNSDGCTSTTNTEQLQDTECEKLQKESNEQNKQPSDPPMDELEEYKFKPKKRKLFTLNDSSISLTPILSTSKTLKRRTLVQSQQQFTNDDSSVQCSQNNSANSTMSIQARAKHIRSNNDNNGSHTTLKIRKRRSTFDFEKTPKSAKIAAKGGSVSKTHLKFSQIKKPFIVCTNMHKEQIEIIQEALVVLGGFQLEHCVNSTTTHVVSYEPRRTLNMLLALVRGLWILDFQWIVDSLRARHWINEERYEMKEFSRAVEICRVERQAFGTNYKCELFSDLGAFYISHRCGPITKTDLKELIELCGGRVVDVRKRAKYILGDANRKLEDKTYITPFWILDSITQMQLLKFNLYQLTLDMSQNVEPANAIQSKFN